MAQQPFKKLALSAALVSLGLGMSAFAQPTPSTTQGGGPTPSTSKSGGPTPSTSKAGGPTPSATSSGTSSASPATSSDASGKAGKPGKSSLDHGDQKFIETAARDGLAEVELGQIAQQKAQNPQVKEFAGRMVQDHGKANDELKSLASSKGLQLPSETDRSHKRKAEELNKKSADKFDHEYMEEMVKDHKKDVKEFEKQAKHAKDADVRNFASKTLPTLQEHLKMAEAAEKAAKGKSSSKPGSSSSGTSSSTGSGGAPSGSTGATGAKTK